MKIKAIIFDKDGTLIDFDSFWVNVAINAIGEILDRLGVADVSVDEVLVSLGVSDRTTSLDGVMCYGTYEQIAEYIYDVLIAHGVKCSLEAVTTLTCEAFNRNAEKGTVRPTCSNLRGVLMRLKAAGLHLAVVTTDVQSVTDRCLNSLGVRDCFDTIITADCSISPKPDPTAIKHLCELYGITADEMIMVGDTRTDMRFAKNGGIRAIGVAANGTNRDILAKETDTVIKDVSCIFDVIEI